MKSSEGAQTNVEPMCADAQERPSKASGQSHTPGPWWVEDRRGVDQNCGGGAIQVQAKHRGEGSSYCVASVNFWESPEANARLIAAAPDLYEALKFYADPANWQDFIARPPGRDSHYHSAHAVLDKGALARAAIAKTECRS